MALSSVHLVTRQTSDLSVKKRKGGIIVGGFGYKIYGMMIVAVMMTVKAYGGGIYAVGKATGGGNVRFWHPVTGHAGGVIFVYDITEGLRVVDYRE